MAGRLLLDAASPALDDDGNPDSGATLLFRVAGDLAAQSTYTTIALSVENANPAVADDAGRFPQFWGPDGSLYDVVWRRGDGTLVKVLYNVGTDTSTASGGGGGTDSDTGYVSRFFWPDEVDNDRVANLEPYAVAVQYPIALAGSKGKCLTNPSGSVIFTVKKNGSSVGTFTVSSSGVFSFAMASATTFSVGDYLTVTAPADTKGIADLAVTFKGALV